MQTKISSIISVEEFPSDKFASMIEYQRTDIRKVGNYAKLELEDMYRIASNVPIDIFCSHNCIYYNGYLKTKKLKSGNETKCEYQISFKGKKVLLNRLLYHNFIDNIKINDIIVNTCKNKGICCNIRHLQKKSNNNNNNNNVNHLTDEIVMKICEDLKNKVKISELCKKYHISRTSISNIKNGITHNQIASHYLK